MTISLEVGKTYINRAGAKVTIVGTLPEGSDHYSLGFRFKDAEGEEYRTDGRWGWGDTTSSSRDLVNPDLEGESLGDILGAALAERDKNAREAHTRLRLNRDQIVKDLGYIAGNGLKTTAIKLHRAIFGSDFNVAKMAIEEASPD